MKSIHYELEEAQKQGKYCIVIDKNDKCQTYYTYQATMVDLFKEVLKCKIQKKSFESAIEKLRVGLVFSMRIGDTLVINVDKAAMDFKETFTSKDFPTDKIFDFAYWCAKDEFNYLKVVREDEDYDLVKNKKMFVMQDKF